MVDVKQAVPPVDISHLRSVTLNDPIIEREVLSLFSDRAAGALRAILKADAPRGRRDGAHRLVGAARAIGAWRLAAVAGEIEQRDDVTDETAEALSQTLGDVVDYVALRLAS